MALVIGGANIHDLDLFFLEVTWRGSLDEACLEIGLHLRLELLLALGSHFLRECANKRESGGFWGNRL